MSETDYIDIVFDGPPGPEGGRFVEVESPPGVGFRFGDWVQRPDGYWVLRFPTPRAEITRLSEALVKAEAELQDIHKYDAMRLSEAKDFKTPEHVAMLIASRDRFAAKFAASEAARERLREALQPFADVIKALEGARELDRDISIGFVSVHANGPGASSCLKTFSDKAFFDAYNAMYSRATLASEPAQPARDAVLEEAAKVADRRALEPEVYPYKTHPAKASREIADAIRALKSKPAKNPGVLEALKPFADFADLVAREHPGWDHDQFRITDDLTMAPFRRAREVYRAISTTTKQC